MSVQPHDRMWQLGEPAPLPRLRAGDRVEVLALPPSLAESGWARSLIGRVGKVVEVHEYEPAIAAVLDSPLLYDVQVTGYAAFPLAPHEVRPVTDDDKPRPPVHAVPEVLADRHPITVMDQHDPERFRLSAATERRAARAWMGAAVSAGSSAEVLACTQLGRTSLRQARAYDELADELIGAAR